jgi:hypothetical protein
MAEVSTNKPVLHSSKVNKNCPNKSRSLEDVDMQASTVELSVNINTSALMRLPIFPSSSRDSTMFVNSSLQLED